MIWRALAVEIIRAIWDQGLYRQNPWLIAVHDYYFEDWVEWRTQKAMKSIDRQVNTLNENQEQEKPVFTEKIDGETPLGGFMRIKAPWKKDD